MSSEGHRSETSRLSSAGCPELPAVLPPPSLAGPVRGSPLRRGPHLEPALIPVRDVLDELEAHLFGPELLGTLLILDVDDDLADTSDHLDTSSAWLADARTRHWPRPQNSRLRPGWIQPLAVKGTRCEGLDPSGAEPAILRSRPVSSAGVGEPGRGGVEVIRGVSKVVIDVEDQERAKEFWTEKMGFELVQDVPYGNERWLEVRSPDGAVNLVLDLRVREAGERQEAPDTLPNSNVMFRCDDLRETYEELRALGVEFPQPPVKQPFGWWSMFNDSEGNRFGLEQT